MQTLFLKNQKGQGLIEYLIIVALMAVAALGITRVLSQTVNVQFAKATAALQGRKANIKLDVPDIQTSDVKKKDMSDFFHGSRSSGNDQEE
jgi:pilus assembly protein Flp/PilA